MVGPSWGGWVALGERAALVEAGPVLGTELQGDRAERSDRPRDDDGEKVIMSISIGPM